MKARELLRDGVLYPEELQIVCEAFDAAWDAVKSDYSDNSTTIEFGRIRLANAVLFAHRNGVRDAGVLRDAAINTMQVAPAKDGA